MTTGMDFGAMDSSSQEWRDISELMDGTVSKLSGASTASFSPAVQAAASAFVTAWEGFGRESATIANGFADALELNTLDFRAVDEAIRDGYDGRLGPQR